MSRCVLSVDVGTTSIKVVILESNGKSFRVLDSASATTNAQIDGSKGSKGRQDAKKICDAVDKAILALDEGARSKVEMVTFCGQMHGMLLWKKDSFAEAAFPSPPSFCSSLATWEDDRCDGEYLSRLRLKFSDSSTTIKENTLQHLLLEKAKTLSSGYGCATLAWLVENSSSCDLSDYDSASTIHGLIAWMLTKEEEENEGEVFIDPTDAHAWGLFDMRRETWMTEEIASLGIPTKLLPTVVPSGSIIGQVSRAAMHRWRIGGGERRVDVIVPMGDHPASVYSTIRGEARVTAAMNFGTSSQMAVVFPNLEAIPPECLSPHVQIRPFLSSLPSSSSSSKPCLIVAASLNGGNVVAAFADMLGGWMKELELSSLSQQQQEPDNQEILRRIIQLANRCEEKTNQSMTICPALFGERETDQAQYNSASIIGIQSPPPSLSSFAAALIASLPRHLFSMFGGKRALQAARIEKIYVSGGLVTSYHRFRDVINNELGIEQQQQGGGEEEEGNMVQVNEAAELDAFQGAIGAALFGLDVHSTK